MVYPPIQYKPKPVDQQTQLKKIYKSALAKGVSPQKIFSEFNKYRQNVIKSKSQKASKNVTNPIKSVNNQSAVTFGSQGVSSVDQINPSEYGISPLVPTNVPAKTQTNPIKKSTETTTDYPSYDVDDFTTQADQDISGYSQDFQETQQGIQTQLNQDIGQSELQKSALLDRFENGDLISDRINTINTKLGEIDSASSIADRVKKENEIAKQLGFTRDQLYKYMEGDYFDAVLKPEYQKEVTEDYDLQLKRNQEDYDTEKARIKQNIDNLSTDYQTENERLKKEIEIQQQNLSKSLGFSGTGFSATGLEALDYINNQNIQLLNDMNNQYSRNNTALNNQMQDLGITMVRATEDINKASREAIQTAANSTLAMIQKIKTQIGTSNADAAVKIQEAYANFQQLVADRRLQQVEETKALQEQIKQQYDNIKANQEELEKGYVKGLENVKTYGMNMSIQDIIKQAQSGQLSPEYAKLAVNQLIQSTVNTLDELSGNQMYGTKNAEQIRKLLGQGMTPTQIVSQLSQSPEFQQVGDFQILEADKFNPARLLNKKTGEVTPIAGSGGGGGGGSGGGGGASSGNVVKLLEGLSSGQRTFVNGIMNNFDNEPTVKKFQVAQQGYSYANSIKNDTTNPADDIGLIYALAKAFDPDSVVREGEYATAQKYVQNWASTFGFSAKRLLSNTVFLTPEARKSIKAAINGSYKSHKSSYDNVYNEYARRINNITGREDGNQFLTQYNVGGSGGGEDTGNSDTTTETEGSHDWDF